LLPVRFRELFGPSESIIALAAVGDGGNRTASTKYDLATLCDVERAADHPVFGTTIAL
jgi:hypothetical protein